MEKRIQERISLNPFGNLKESSIDDQLFQLKGVCLFGTRFSENNREYSSAAVDDLVNMAEGTKMFINHINKEEERIYRGTRDVRNWGGVFSNPSRRGDAIHADLHCRESVFPLLKDIARLSPKKIGFSLDAQVSVSNSDKGEVIESIKKLREFSLVSEAATCQSLQEALQNGGDKDVMALEMFLDDIKNGTSESRKISEANERSKGEKLSRQQVIDGVEEFFSFAGSGKGKKLTKDQKDQISDVFGVNE